MTVNASEVVKKQLMKKIITNATCTLWFPYSDSIFRKHWVERKIIEYVICRQEVF